MKRSAWKSGKWNKQVLQENNLLLHARLQRRMCQAAVCTGMEDAPGEVGEGECFSFSVQLGHCLPCKAVPCERQSVCWGQAAGWFRPADTMAGWAKRFSVKAFGISQQSERPGIVQLLT